MSSRVLETLLAVAGFFLIFIFFSEEFQQALRRLQVLLKQRPRLKYVAYPLAALLGLAAAALIIHALVQLAASRFSYD